MSTLATSPPSYKSQLPLYEIALMPYMPIPDINGEEWDDLEPASVLDALVELVGAAWRMSQFVQTSYELFPFSSHTYSTLTHISHTYSTLFHISHTCDSLFPHRPHYDTSTPIVLLLYIRLDTRL